MRKFVNDLKYNKTGITMISLVITIIVLLILAGITIGAITGDNGIINNAGNAKEEAEIADEKEIVNTATVQAMGQNKFGNITKEDLQNFLDSNTGSNVTEVVKNIDDLIVYFKETNRFYNVDTDGNVTGPVEISKVTDEYPGDITKSSTGATLAGTIDEPYQINCIEDLCAFSNAVNSGESYFEKYIELTIDLDFLSSFSYINGSIAVAGQIESKSSIEELMEELAENVGFVSIGNTTNYFQGSFFGNGHSIGHLFINSSNDYIGFFGYINSYSSRIEHLNLEDVQIKGNNYVGGIIGQASGYVPVTDCSVSGYITGNDQVGGIAGRLDALNTNNINYATVTGNTLVGGIVGNTWGSYSPSSSNKNHGNISGNSEVGGIIGRLSYGIIEKSVNYGEINGNTKIGGIIGRMYYNSGVIVRNCYNVGNIKGETSIGGISGSIEIWNGSGGELYYSYNIGTVTANSNVGSIAGTNAGTVKNCYYLQGTYNGGINGEDIENQAESEDEDFMKGQDFIDLLNTLNDSTIWKQDIENENTGYPIFEN